MPLNSKHLSLRIVENIGLALKATTQLEEAGEAVEGGEQSSTDSIAVLQKKHSFLFIKWCDMQALR